MYAYLVPYEIHFDDTMAYGSHHFLTNFKFQCAGREHLLFSDALYRDPAFREDFDKVILYTAEAYSRNLGPAQLGDRLVVLTTVEERTAIGLRFCFRTLREDGEPVAVGYQTVLCAARATNGIVAFPASFNRCFDAVHQIVEPAAELSFRERVHRGGKDVRALFPEPLRQLARGAWTGQRPQPAIVPVVARPFPSLTPDAPVLLMGGQGTFDADVLSGLVRALPEAAAALQDVRAVVTERLGTDCAPLFAGGPEAATALAVVPDLDQIGIFLTGVLTAQALTRQGRAPGLLIGHSFGEIAALTAAGVLSVREGTVAVCERVRALQPSEGLGTLAAVGLPADATRAAIVTSGLPLTLAGTNHATQSVVAGPRDALLALQGALAAQGKPVTLVASRYPFHSEALRPAAARYAEALRHLPTAAPHTPVWSPIDARLYDGAPGEVAAALSGHLLRPFDFPSALTQAAQAGARTFIDASGGRLGRIAERVLGDSATVESLALTPAAPPSDNDRIAIVSVGCIFPGGARDPEAYWHALRVGTIGVRPDPSLEDDFVAHPLRADKALTTLAGRVDDADIVAPPGCAPFNGWSRVQRLLAVALHQCVAGTRSRPSADRIACLLGSTADGSDAFDDALTVAALRLDPPTTRALTSALGAGNTGSLAPHAALQAVIRDRLGDVRTTLVDAACASSLYTLALGAAMLRSGEADLVLAGGAFAPGAGNNCLFSQFRGLSTTAIRPFDAAADGVIFGEGAGMLGLKRLADAERDGDRIHAVVAGIGLSSDGRSPSANVPRAEGQLLAIERAWEGLDPSTVGFIEAHGTATPAGDGTELGALHSFFRRVETTGLIPIGSVKAQTGHLGWVAGTASVIKLCKMMEHATLLPQHAFTTPGKPLQQVADRFEVLRAEKPWTPPSGPRRAATSGFGFGGTNAHVILEQHHPGRIPAAAARTAPCGPLAIVAVEALWPDEHGAPATGGVATRLRREAVTLPDTLRVLPDLAEDMDVTQRLAVRGAHAMLSGLAAPDLHARTSVVLGLEGKTDRGVEAIRRVMADRVARLLDDAERRGAATPGAAHDATAQVAGLRPSTGYTLQSMMPNVTAGRVANLLHLQGPNFVVDEGAGTLSSALAQAPRLLALGSDLVLAGGLHHGLHVPADGRAPAADGLVLLGLTTPAIAEARGLKVLATLRPDALPDDIADADGLDRRGARGGAALVAAVLAASRGERPLGPWPVDPVAAAPRQTPGFGADVPVRYGTPTLVSKPTGPGKAWRDRRVLILSSTRAEAARVAAALSDAGAVPTVRTADAIDLKSEATAASTLADLPELDVVLAVRTLGSFDGVVAEATTDRALLDLTFLATRQLYGRFVTGELDIAALHLKGATATGSLHPVTGQLAGMLKSVAREGPPGRVHVVSTDHDDLVLALDQLARDLAVTGRNVESAWRGDERFERVLTPVPVASHGPSPLGSASVVVATGGARGVTAVLVEALLRKHGCTVVLLGRTEEGGAPAELLAAPEDQLDTLEQTFYASEVARDPAAKIGDLRRRFERYRSAHELHHTLQRLRSAPGEVVYRKVDVTRADEIDAVVTEIADRYGRLDLVVHGAGLQTSKKLDRRKLDELRRNMDVKLLGLNTLYAASTARFGVVPFHILTSAFSYFGNDGQADYGAANETLDRLCAAFPGWTSIGWLAWDRIGMTRSPEYAVLGAARNLRGISADEGAQLFLDVVDGVPTTAIYHQFTAGEVAWYDLEIAEASAPEVTPVIFDAATVPCLPDHLVRGTPTVPGAWSLDRMLPAALPDEADAVTIEDIRFSRFVRVPSGTRQQLRLNVERGPDGAITRLLGDIVHRSGTVLQADVEHATARFRTAATLPHPVLNPPKGGTDADDPYCAPDAPITLRNGFNCLREIRITPEGRVARFEATSTHGAQHLPALLLDAAWRLSAMHAEPGVVYAPVRFDRVHFTRDALAESTHPVTLRASAPRVDGDVVHCERVEAVTRDGRVILSVDGGLARRIP